MPRDGRNTDITTPPNRDGIHTLPRLGMEDFKTITAATGLVARAAEEPSVEAPADPADGPAVITRHGASADPVGGVPEGDEGVAAADG